MRDVIAHCIPYFHQFIYNNNHNDNNSTENCIHDSFSFTNRLIRSILGDYRLVSDFNYAQLALAVVLLELRECLSIFPASVAKLLAGVVIFLKSSTGVRFETRVDFESEFFTFFFARCAMKNWTSASIVC